MIKNLQESLEVDDGTIFLTRLLASIAFRGVYLHEVVLHYRCNILVVVASFNLGCLLLVHF